MGLAPPLPPHHYSPTRPWGRSHKHQGRPRGGEKGRAPAFVGLAWMPSPHLHFHPKESLCSLVSSSVQARTLFSVDRGTHTCRGLQEMTRRQCPSRPALLPHDRSPTLTPLGLASLLSSWSLSCGGEGLRDPNQVLQFLPRPSGRRKPDLVMSEPETLLTSWAHPPLHPSPLHSLLGGTWESSRRG